MRIPMQFLMILLHLVCKKMLQFGVGGKVNMFLSKSANLSRGGAEIHSFDTRRVFLFDIFSVFEFRVWGSLSLCLTRDKTIKWGARQVKSNYGCKLIPRGMVLAIYRDVYVVCCATSPKTSLVTHNACWRKTEMKQAGGRGVKIEESQGIERWEKELKYYAMRSATTWLRI